ncbi:MAG: hypothetical protein NDJ94_00285 [Vicinamibacteria bacterium]|nr:hypothetical protein [Vicinamibacteria bacterium]
MNMLLAGLAALVAFVLFLLGALFTLVSSSNVVIGAYLAALVAGWQGARWWRTRRWAGSTEGPALRARRSMVSLCLVMAAALGVTLATNMVMIRPPSQAALAGWFQGHRAELERMRELIEKRQSAGLEFQRLLHDTGCQGAHEWSDGAISFGYRSWGMANQGWRATLVWSPTEPKPLLATVDGFPATRVPGSDRVFARIDGSWYAHIVW